MNFEVKMTSGILYGYLLRKNYLSLSGWIGIILGIGLLASYFIFGSHWYIIAGVIILLFPPWSLFTSTKKQMLLNPAFKKPIQYQIDDEGIKVSQGDNTVFVPWEHLFRVAATKQWILVYTSPVNVWILPYKALGGNADKLIEMVREKLPKAKRRNI